MFAQADVTVFQTTQMLRARQLTVLVITTLLLLATALMVNMGRSINKRQKKNNDTKIYFGWRTGKPLWE